MALNKPNVFRILILLLFFVIAEKSQSQTWRTWIDPLYKSHVLINDSQFVKAEKTLHYKKEKIDTSHPIWYHSWCRIHQNNDSLEQALYFAKQAFLSLAILQDNIEKFTVFKKIYYMDIQYLSLYYRYLLIDKIDKSKSTKLKRINKELIAFITNEQKQLNSYIPTQNEVLVMTIPRLIRNLHQLNDSIDYHKAISSVSVTTISSYLNSLAGSDEQLQALPPHLKSFYKNASDSLYLWEFNSVLNENLENGFLFYAKTYPHSPYYRAAMLNADKLAFQTCRIKHQQTEYEEYLKKYPNGRYRDQAKKLLRFLTVVPVPFLRLDGKYIFVDSSNHRTWIDSTYDFAYPFKMNYHSDWSSNASCLITGCALVMHVDSFGRNQWYYIEKDGNTLNGKSYDEIRQIELKKAFVTSNGRYGLINEYGTEILPPIFEKLYYDTLNKLSVVFNGDKWSLYNANGKRLTNFVLDEIVLNEDLSMVPLETVRFLDNRIVCKRNSRPWVINFLGKPIFMNDYEYLTPYVQGYSIAKLANKESYVLIDTIGRILTDTVDELLQHNQSKLFVLKKNGTYRVSKFKDSICQWTVNSFKVPMIADYWGNTQFAVWDHNSWMIYDSNSDVLADNKSKIDDNLILIGDQILVQKKRIKKKGTYRNSLKWFNPHLHDLSKIISEQIAILNHSRILVKYNGQASLFGIDETEYPIFSTSKELKIPHFKSITRSQDPSLFIAHSDTIQLVVDTIGKVVFNGNNQEIEILQNGFITTSKKGQFKTLYNTKGQKRFSGFNDLIEPSFPGYYLLQKHQKWFWMDYMMRSLSEKTVF